MTQHYCRAHFLSRHLSTTGQRRSLFSPACLQSKTCLLFHNVRWSCPKWCSTMLDCTSAIILAIKSVLSALERICTVPYPVVLTVSIPTHLAKHQLSLTLPWTLYSCVTSSHRAKSIGCETFCVSQCWYVPTNTAKLLMGGMLSSTSDRRSSTNQSIRTLSYFIYWPKESITMHCTVQIGGQSLSLGSIPYLSVSPIATRWNARRWKRMRTTACS